MKKKLLALGAVIVASIATFITINSQAFQSGGSLVSFNTTNVISAGTSVTSWPTNTSSTNGGGFFTGGPLYLGYVDHYGISVQGLNVSTNSSATNVIGIGYVLSMATGTPQLTLGTNIWTANATNIIQNDWQNQTNWIVLTIPQPLTATNWINVGTNIVTTAIGGDANWIGIVAITNSGFNGGFLTNFGVYLNTKFTVKPFSP